MGKGDSKTRKGKMFRKSYGVTRPSKMNKRKKQKAKKSK